MNANAKAACINSDLTNLMLSPTTKQNFYHYKGFLPDTLLPSSPPSDIPLGPSKSFANRLDFRKPVFMVDAYCLNQDFRLVIALNF
jgi:hypothetical protein